LVIIKELIFDQITLCDTNDTCPRWPHPATATPGCATAAAAGGGATLAACGILAAVAATDAIDGNAGAPTYTAGLAEPPGIACGGGVIGGCAGGGAGGEGGTGADGGAATDD
jgi:hypothetical protein